MSLSVWGELQYQLQFFTYILYCICKSTSPVSPVTTMLDDCSTIRLAQAAVWLFFQLDEFQYTMLCFLLDNRLKSGALSWSFQTTYCAKLAIGSLKKSTAVSQKRPTRRPRLNASPPMFANCPTEKVLYLSSHQKIYIAARRGSRLAILLTFTSRRLVFLKGKLLDYFFCLKSTSGIYVKFR